MRGIRNGFRGLATAPFLLDSGHLASAIEGQLEEKRLTALTLPCP